MPILCTSGTDPENYEKGFGAKMSSIYAYTSAVSLHQLSSWSVLFIMPHASRGAHWVIDFELNAENEFCAVLSILWLCDTM